MCNRKNIQYELEISCTILKTSINALANKWGVSHTHVRDVARGKNQSARIRKEILQTIEEAQEIVSFNQNKSEMTRDQCDEERRQE